MLEVWARLTPLPGYVTRLTPRRMDISNPKLLAQSLSSVLVMLFAIEIPSGPSFGAQLPPGMSITQLAIPFLTLLPYNLRSGYCSRLAHYSNGRTNGIASPSSEAQAAAIRQAYASAGITNFNDTGYLECHGTGTPAGDPTEVDGAGVVFAPTRPADKPLIIGSVSL